MDNNLINGVLFLDLKKAFDTVDHNILLSKLQLYGIRGTAHRWFQSYLKDRKQICKINQTMSDAKSIHCGVPQGTNLGPMLFLLYINDLPNCLTKTSSVMFADDTSLSCEGSSSAEIEGKLNHDLEMVHMWLTTNKLTLNQEKTEYMIIGSQQRLDLISEDINVSLANEPISRVQTKKVLGVIIDEKLKWHEHNAKQCKTISSRIGLLRRARDFVTQDVLVTMYNSLVLPHFTYCSTVWQNSNTDHINKLHKLQKRAARVITRSTYDERSSQIFETLNWKSIKEILEERQLVMTFKALRGLGPWYLTQSFNLNSNTSHELRSNNPYLHLPKPRTDFLKKSFSYQGAVSWNKFPEKVIDNVIKGNMSLTFKSFINNSFVSN